MNNPSGDVVDVDYAGARVPTGDRAGSKNPTCFGSGAMVATAEAVRVPNSVLPPNLAFRRVGPACVPHELASRARRRVRPAATVPDTDARRREGVDAFLGSASSVLA